MVGRLLDGPLGAFVELRLRLAWRRLRGRGGVPELVARVISFAVLVPAGLLFAGLLATGMYASARLGKGPQVDVGVSAVFFGIWQAWTAVALSLQEQEAVDLKRFLVYPLRPGRIFALGQAAATLGDPFSIFWCILLLGALGGAAAGRPGWWLLPYALTLALFVAATVTYVALLQELVGRFLRGRRLRGVAVGLLYLGIGAGCMFVAGTGKKFDPAVLRQAFERVQWIAWPGALAAAAGRHLFSGRVLAALPWIAALAAATAAAGWGAFRLAVADARAGGPPAARPSAAARDGWLLAPLDRLPGRLGPLLEREAKQLARHPLPAVLLLVLPGVAGIMAWLATPLLAGEASDVLRALPLLGFAIYVHLTTQAFWLNAFGWERGGARLLFLAPVDPAEVLAAKNAAAWLFSSLVYLVSVGVTVALAGSPPAWALAAAPLLHAGMAPWLMGLGNLVSVLNPRVTALTLQRSGNIPALSGLIGMAIISGVTLLFALPVLLALRLDEGWVLPVAWAVLGAAGLAAYRATLPRVGRLLVSRRETLLAAVTGDDL